MLTEGEPVRKEELSAICIGTTARYSPSKSLILMVYPGNIISGIIFATTLQVQI
uniref:Uncharacterized protein n=1 Tax=Lepeophtheirus salmonis TaxID=72036 RepID=A0A0K2U4P8_LEPSM